MLKSARILLSEAILVLIMVILHSVWLFWFFNLCDLLCNILKKISVSNFTLSQYKLIIIYIALNDIIVLFLSQISQVNLVYQIHKHVFFPRELLCNDDSFVKYSCNQVYDRLMVTTDMYDFKIPYLLGNSFGCPCGLIELSKLKTIIEDNDNEYKCIEIVPFNPQKTAPSTVSLQMLGSDPNAVGASHCQDGQGEKINDLRRVIF